MSIDNRLALERIESKEWYASLVEDCKAIITEAVFTSRWALVEGYHELGKRVVTDSNYKKWEQNRAGAVLQGLAKAVGVSDRTLYYAVQFYEKFPDLDQLREVKNITWNKIVTLYLPAPAKETPVLPDGKYRVLYADPPWEYNFSRSDSREIENQYPTMTVDEICALPIDKVASPESVLFLWATSPKLREAMQVIDAWHFDYKTCMVWVKDKIGMGYYARQKHELLLIGARGNLPVPDPERRPESVILAPRTRHSEKPAEFAEAIERMYPGLPKIELFSRNPREGWTSWGNESSARA